MKITKRQLRKIIKEEKNRLLRENIDINAIESYLLSHGLEAGIDYDWGGDGVKEDWHIVGIQTPAEDLVMMLDQEVYPESPVPPRYLRNHRNRVYWT